jgi:hypothetical protein
MVKVWGNYCGPNWTAGKNAPASSIDSLPYVAPTDDLDAACMAHDRDCSKGGCSAKGDTRLRNAALRIAILSPSLREPALLIAAAMTATAPTRKR